MRINSLKAIIKTALRGAAVLLFGTGAATAQINLTAGPATATLPDGSAVPMWGYTCGNATDSVTGATCAALNTAGGWSPVVITVPTGQNLTISLTNSLSFTSGGIPTSLVIVGQLGGGLGTTATSTPSPDHSNAQPLTWPIAGDPPGAPLTGVGTPPAQGNRVQSFSTEVAAGATTALTWTAPRPGTYLIESGTHPSIQGPMGLYGILVVTAAPSGTTPGTAYPAVGTTPAVTYNAEIPLLFSEIDPVQNKAVNTAVNTAGFSETNVWSGLPGACGNPASPAGIVNTCYPPTVNYTPLYYMINGVAFNKTSASTSLFPTTPATGITGTVLVRMVNAGLHMHVPSIVGSQTGAAVAPAPLPPAGFSLIAEDGNLLPGKARVQSEVFMAAGKTYDVMINVPTGATALPVFDRELSLSGNKVARDAGMLAYIGVNGAGLPVAGVIGAATANPDTYNSVITGQTLTVSDPFKGVIANDVNIYGVQVQGTVPGLTLNADGTFTYTGAPTTFTYCGNGSTTGPACAMVTLGAAPKEAVSGITMGNSSYTSNATFLKIAPPGILAADKDAAGYPLTVNAASAAHASGLTLTVDPNGGFNASVAAAGTYTFTYKAQNSQGTVSTSTATVTLVFPTPSNLAVKVLDGKDKTTPITDYRWIIEEDRTFYIDPKCAANPAPAGCPTGQSGIVPTFGTNFHTSYMPVVAAGCTGTLSCEGGQSVLGQKVVCDIGNGICRPDATGNGEAILMPGAVHLDPTKRYYISVLPGDAANPFEHTNLTASCTNGSANAPDASICGHGMGGAPIAAACTPVPPATTCTGALAPVTIYAQPTPFPPSKLSVFVYEDDFPLNGEQDGGGGVDVLSPNEPGLGHFNITLFDDAGGTGDATGQMTYDMFNQPLSNSLAGTIDPATGLDACPITAESRIGMIQDPNNPTGPMILDPTQTGITGTIVTCPKYEAGGTVLSPLAGQAVVANLMPGRYGVVATPAADRIAAGEEWLQTNTLDGQKAHDSFLRVGEPSFFQEFGPAGFHVSIGFANPKIINGRLAGVCSGLDSTVSGTNCTNTVTGTVTTERMSRTPDERLYSSGDNSSFSFTQCYVSFGDPDGEDFAFTKCDANGNFTLSGLPDGDWRVTVFDQWNDMLVDGLSTPVRLASSATANLGQIAINQWQANIYTKTFFDENANGTQDSNEPGLSLVATNVRFRDGSYSNFNNTDLSGNAGFNEEFPLFSWYVVETDSTRFKNTGIHVVYDAGGPSDGSTCGGTTGMVCGNSSIGHFMANTAEQIPVPPALRVPGAYYCSNADCTDAPAPYYSTLTPNSPGGSTGRIDPPWVTSEGWQGYSGQNSFLEFGKKPYAAGETGGIHGEVIYASTRPFDDPALLIHTSWTPDVPGVTINLYQEGTAPDGTTSLTLVDTTKTSSFDDWAQGFRSDGIPNMNCPGQGRDTGTDADLFFFSLYNQPAYLDMYNHGVAATQPLPNNSQFKCYDGMHNWNQLQPAPYDGMYKFPSVTATNPTTGKPTGTSCTICVPNHAAATTDWDYGLPMLPAGKYVVEVVVPPGYELVKEEDKNILIGDNYIAPVTVQFPGLGGAIYILPDQAEVAGAYNANNPQNPTDAYGRTTLPSTEADTGSVEQLWPCVGAARIVPDYISLYPNSHEVAPFAGATRNLCDRKEVTLTEQAAALAKFWIFTSTHVAAHFTGVITDDFTSEFDPFSPQFGEKFAPPDLPISIKDWTGTEISRVYADHWGAYDGLTYSTWEVNPPNPTGYAPTMMVTCMNDPGTGTTPDPLFNPQYSQFCYEIPFMPGQTQYMDTPVTPVSAFAGAGYNNPDCAYTDLTPAIKEVDGDGVGPWVATVGNILTITSQGIVSVPNNAYSGPSATTPPFNQKTINRNYGFGSTAGTVALVGSDGISYPLTGMSWSDGVITGTVPSGLPNCAMQQQVQYGGSTAQCGQLVITSSNGKQSIDTVTVTIGGKAPTHVVASGSIQSAIDAANPGDLIIVDPTCTTGTTIGACTVTSVKSTSTHSELVIMWKPVRLQGVGAVSSIINANTHPAGKLDDWRARVTCLFGLGLDGSPKTWNPGCGSTWTGWAPTAINPQVDRLPTEATVGWDATLNGNLAELLQEPSLMGALEGAGITVLSKGVNFPSDPWATTGATFPVGTPLLTSGDCATGNGGANPFPSSFWCNPSSIDGLEITDSSQGGGGVFVHAWGHNLQIANNQIKSNSGTLSGGINVGQGEFPPAYLGGAGVVNGDPGSCQTSTVANLQLPYCFNENVNIHNNAITSNASTGDELFSATPAGAGGVSFCTGADYYKFNYNWVCGNLSTGDGGGIGQLGFVYNGDIEHNTIIFNQSTNPTIATNGGGLLVMGAPDVDPPCSTVDQDCVGATNLIGPSDGAGPGLVINANLLLGNAAESGSGGGLRLQNINGSEVVAFPTAPDGANGFPGWYSVQVTNNIIANNVAGWDGAGVSMVDAFKVNFINNTVMSNDTTASSGVLFNTLGAPLASSEGPCPTYPNTGLPANPCVTTSSTQPAGLVTIQNSAVLTANLPATITCPAGHFAPTDSTTCRKVSYPLIANDVFYQNRTFSIQVGSLGAGTLNQQNVVALVPTLSQAATGQCVTGANYWDIGVRGDTGPGNHSSTVTLAPTYSFLTDAATDYTTGNNTGASPAVVSQYCNGSRIPPELGSSGYQVPPGISDATVPNPIFNLTPAATVDEGNNWINISWGPLALINPLNNAPLSNYGPTAVSPVINYISSGASTYAEAPSLDFFNNPRKANNAVDAGAVEFVVAAPTAALAVTGGPLNFGKVFTGTTSAAQTLTLNNTGGLSATGITLTFSSPFFSRPAGAAGGTCGATLGNGTTCTINVVFAPTAIGAVSGTLTIGTNVAVTGSPVILSGTGANPVGAILAPPTWNATAPRGATVATGPTQIFTLTNNGSVTLTGITQATLHGTNPTDWTIVRAASTCGPAGGGQLLGQTTLATGASCIVTVQFRPLTAELSNALAATLSVTDAAGTQTAALTGNVLSLISISPTSGFRGTTVPVTLTGNNLTGATAVTVSGTGVTCTITGTPTATTVNANCAITATAGLTARNVTVTTPAGTTNAVTFTVTTPPPPTLTLIAPNTGVRGTAVPVTLTGTNLTGATAVPVSGAGVTVSSLSVTNATTATATFTITATAALTARNVTVTTPGGTSAAQSFTVLGATLTSINQTSGVRGTSVPVVLSGTNLTGATAVTVSGAGVTCTIGTPAPTTTTVNAICAIAATAGNTARTVTVTTPAGTTNTVLFTVTGATVGFSGPTPALNTGGTTTKTGTITVTNTVAAGATAGPLTLTAAPTITRTAGTGAFSIVTTGPTPSSCLSGTVLTQGQSCTIVVQYVPSGTATSTAHVTLADTGATTASQNGANFNAN